MITSLEQDTISERRALPQSNRLTMHMSTVSSARMLLGKGKEVQHLCKRQKVRKEDCVHTHDFSVKESKN